MANVSSMDVSQAPDITSSVHTKCNPNHSDNLPGSAADGTLTGPASKIDPTTCSSHSENASVKVESNTNDRINRLLLILDHRKILRERIIQCRQAVEFRLLGTNCLYPAAGLDSSHENRSDNEVETFRALCREVTLSSTALKRPNLILGNMSSSKGAAIMSAKKVQIALSEGANNYNNGNTEQISREQSSITSSSYHQDEFSRDFVREVACEREQSSLHDLSGIGHTENGIFTSRKEMSMPEFQPPDSASSEPVIMCNAQMNASLYRSLPKANKTQSTSSLSVDSRKRSFSTKINRSASNARNFNASSDTTQPPTSTSSNRLSGMNESGVNCGDGSFLFQGKTCPELEKLRLKRRAIISKLEAVARKRRMVALSEQPCGCKDGKPGALINRKNSKKSLPVSKVPSALLASQQEEEVWKKSFAVGFTSPLLPSRVKTQWDYVLEEMRWLATDFIEERKWKRAGAKLLSEAVKVHRLQTNSSYNQDTAKIGLKSDSFEVVQSHNTTIPSSATLSDRVISNDFTRYRDTTTDDIKATRQVSRSLNGIIDLCWNNIVDGEQINAVNRKLNSSLLTSAIFDVRGSELAKESSAIVTDGKRNEDSDVPENSFDTNGESQTHAETASFKINRIDRSHEDITYSIRELVESMPSLNDRVNNCIGTEEYDKTFAHVKMKPFLAQLKYFEFMNSLWNPVGSIRASMLGGVLTGCHSCGKSFAIGALMWKLRSERPQLLLCHTASVSRWLHELQQFPDLSIHVHGHQKRHRKVFHDDNLNSCHVVICEISRLDDLAKDTAQRRDESRAFVFSAIIVDTRFPTVEKYVSSLSLDQLKKKARRIDGSTPCSSGLVSPQDICTSTWWANLMSLSANSCAKRIVIERKDSKSDRGNSTIPNEDHNEKCAKDLLAFKVAFIFHPLFKTSKSLPWKKVLSWARRHYMSSKDPKCPQSSIIIPVSSSNRAHGINEILQKLFKCVTFDLTFPDVWHRNRGELLNEQLEPEWTIRLCPLPPSQRDAYDRTCIYLRGSLSLSSIKRENDECSTNKGLGELIRAAKSLLCLRRVCFYSHLGCSPVERNMVISARLNASQPNRDIARIMMERSGKLSELLSFLSEECGYNLTENSPFDMNSDRSNVSLKKKKVLILACLPEVILLTSSFLNSVGVPHAVLMCSYRSFSLNRRNYQNINDSFSPHDWVRCQQLISRFQCLDSFTCAQEGSLDVLVASPFSLGKSALGLSASDADFIVSLDEDWSGRGEIELQSILMKNALRHREHVHTSHRFIKFISELTCEQNFLSLHFITGNGIKFISTQIMSCNSVPLDVNIVRYQGEPTSGIRLPRRQVQPDSGCGHEKLFGRTSTTSEPSMTDLQPLSLSKQVFAYALCQVEFVASVALLKFKCHWDSRIVLPPTSHKNSADTHHLSSCIRTLMTQYRFATGQSIVNLDHNADVTLAQSHSEELLPRSDNRRLLRKALIGEPHSNSSPAGKLDCAITSHIFYTTRGREVNFKYFDKVNVKPVHNTMRKIQKSTYSSDLVFRENIFPHLYGCLLDISDGNQGKESLVYFPPIFPHLLEYSRLSQKTRQLIEMLGDASDDAIVKYDMIRDDIMSQARKRKSSVLTSNTKRTRVQSTILHCTDTADDSMKHFDCSFPSLSDEDFELFPSANLLEMDSTLSNVTNQVQNFFVKDDFGLLGQGDMPSLSSSTQSASRSTVSTTVALWFDSFEPPSSDYSRGIRYMNDTDDVASFGYRLLFPLLDAVILSIKTRKQYGHNLNVTTALTRATITSPMPVPGPLFVSRSHAASEVASKEDIDQYSMEQKMRSEISDHFLSADNLVSSSTSIPRVSDFIPSKFSWKDERSNAHVAINSSNHLGFHHRVADRLLKISNEERDEKCYVNPNIRELLPNENTGDAARSVAARQLAAMQASVFTVGATDFSPFTTVHVSSPLNRETETKSHRYVNAQLPMGVRVPTLERSTGKDGNENWSSEEDARLRVLADSFKYSWNLISLALRINLADKEYRINPAYSAKQCRDRWVQIASDESSPHGNDDTTASVPAKGISNKLVPENVNEYDESGKFMKWHRRILDMINASSKRSSIKLAVPGLSESDGPRSISIVSAHHSHTQSVQDAVTEAAGSSGPHQTRQEMWPLQYLDLREKHRQFKTSDSTASQPLSSGSGTFANASQPSQGQSQAKMHANKGLQSQSAKQSPSRKIASNTSRLSMTDLKKKDG